MKTPVTVGARELKTRLGAYLRRVQEGQRIVVTERGTPVAELRSLRARETRAARRGSCAWRRRGWSVGRREPASGDCGRSGPAEGPWASAVLDDREDRF